MGRASGSRGFASGARGRSLDSSTAERLSLGLAVQYLRTRGEDREVLLSHRECGGRSGRENSGTGRSRTRQNPVSVVIRSADLSGHWLVGYTGRKPSCLRLYLHSSYLIGKVSYDAGCCRMSGWLWVTI
jgi:hypothetical protein